MAPRRLEPRTLRLLAVHSNQLSYETPGLAWPPSPGSLACGATAAAPPQIFQAVHSHPLAEPLVACSSHLSVVSEEEELYPDSVESETAESLPGAAQVCDLWHGFHIAPREARAPAEDSRHSYQFLSQ